ncbi:MAG: PAS domain-containing protein, partial [Candidatus Aquicultor sp.]
MKEKRKPEEKKSSEQLLRDTPVRDTPEGKLARSSGILTELKERTSEELLHELQVHQIELEMQNEELRKAQLALEESRQRFSDLYDFAPVGYFTFTPEALIKEVNLTGSTLLGVVRQNLINLWFRRIVTAKDQDLWDQHFLKVLQEGEKQACDLMLKREDGSTFYAGLESIRREENRGEFEVHTTVTDITERKRVEETLQESEERYRDLVESSQDLICTHDLDGNLLSVNEAPVRALGYSREFLMQVKMRDLLTPEQHDQFEAYLKKIKEEGRASGILRLQTASGETRYWEYNNTLRTEGVVVPMVRGMAHDVTERRKAEEAHRHEHERAQGYLDTVETIIVALNTEGRITTINRKGCQLFGCEEDELIGQPWFSTCLPQPDGMEKMFPFFLKLLSGEIEGTEYYENPIVTQGGEIRQIAWHNALLRDKKGQVIGALSSGEDITERMRMETLLKESEK